MITETVTIPAAELAQLQERIRKLSTQKSYLQLVNALMTRISEASGLDDTIRRLLEGVLNVLGGTHIVIYYKMDDDITSTNVYGAVRHCETIDDPLVQQVFTEGIFIEKEEDFSKTLMLEDVFRTSVTWVIPLKDSAETIGVLKLEGLHIAAGEMREPLPAFFSHAALILKNEIHNHTRLNDAFDQLQEQSKLRVQSEDALLELNSKLEIRVEERTAELEERNWQLDSEIRERTRVEIELRAVSHYTRSLIESSLDPLVTIGPDGAITDVNAATEAVTGRSRKELLGTDFCNYFTDPARARAGYQQVFRDGQVQDYLLEICHRDGHTVSVLYNASLYRDEKGDVIGIFATARNITILKRAENELHLQTVQLEQEIAERQCAQELLAVKHAQLEEMNRTLEERVTASLLQLREKDQLLIQQSRLAAMGEMLNNIAHQWRQPLNSMGLLLAGIREAWETDRLDRAYLEKTLTTGNLLLQNMSATISDFAGFFRPDRSMKVFSVRAQLNSVLTMVTTSFRNHNISILVDAESDCLLAGFPNEYSQVLLNLLANSREAIEQSGADAGEIQMRLFEQDGLGCITVRDTGGGISGDILDRIFDPYFSSKESGTGIGLYMSKMIIERNMGGHIEAKNIDGGAEFTVACPLAPEDQTWIIPSKSVGI
ncbi:MAG: PAS domain S-box protein [Desulfuromonadaceae bacterium]|nr:PAS domain S-box protein [Desulfuromonadaceae bacterium]MDD5105552.1 PAS domain S-box protein [Desulfuromonadaceae bacterium]